MLVSLLCCSFFYKTDPFCVSLRFQLLFEGIKLNTYSTAASYVKCCWSIDIVSF